MCNPKLLCISLMTKSEGVWPTPTYSISIDTFGYGIVSDPKTGKVLQQFNLNDLNFKDGVAELNLTKF